MKRFIISAGSLFFFILSVQCWAMGNVKRVSPTSSDDVVTLINKTTQILDEVSAAPLFNADAVGGVITISSSGNYQLVENLIYPITISASKVSLNLNTYKIACSTNNQSAITISSASALQQIAICNGYLESSAATPGSGVYIPANTSLVSLDQLTISGFANGVWCAGTNSSNKVTKCNFSDLSLVANAKGILFDWSDANIVKNSSAMYSTLSGFELNNGQANCFYDCKALKSTGTATIVGFKSTAGTSNLFQRCVTQQTKTSSGIFGNKACGFLLTGTEQRTIISNCVSSENDVLSSSTVAVTYGIHVAPTVLSGTDLLSTLTLWQNVGSQAVSLSWSPAGDFLVAGLLGGSAVKIYKFDGSNLNFVTSLSITSVIDCAWSPDGKYVAVTDNAATRYIRVYSFDGRALTLVASYATGIAQNTAYLKWSHNGKFLFASINSSGTNATIVSLSFNGTNLGLVDAYAVTGGAAGNWVRMSVAPDSSVLALSRDGAANTFSMLPVSPDGKFGTLVTTLLRQVIGNFSWSACGRYVAVPLDNRVVAIIRWLPSDASPILSIATTVAEPTNNVVGTAWSPDGNYFMYWDSVGNGKLFAFMGDGVVLLKTASTVVNGGVWGSVFSPDGKYIAAASDAAPAQLAIVRVMYGPLNCIVDNCKISDVLAANSNLGRGIVLGASNNYATQCVSSGNGVNVSYGIQNAYWGRFGISRNTVQPFDNISCPTML